MLSIASPPGVRGSPVQGTSQAPFLSARPCRLALSGWRPRGFGHDGFRLRRPTRLPARMAAEQPNCSDIGTEATRSVAMAERNPGRADTWSLTAETGYLAFTLLARGEAPGRTLRSLSSGILVAWAPAILSVPVGTGHFDVKRILRRWRANLMDRGRAIIRRYWVDLDGARAALSRGAPAELLGLAECGWFDTKDGVYQRDDPVKSEELVKDVAGFANARTGGLVVVGYSTRKDHDQEVVDALRPVPRALVDLHRYRKLIRERVIPPLRGVSVEWIRLW